MEVEAHDGGVGPPDQCAAKANSSVQPSANNAMVSHEFTTPVKEVKEVKAPSSAGPTMRADDRQKGQASMMACTSGGSAHKSTGKYDTPMSTPRGGKCPSHNCHTNVATHLGSSYNYSGGSTTTGIHASTSILIKQILEFLCCCTFELSVVDDMRITLQSVTHSFRHVQNCEKTLMREARCATVWRI